MQPSIERVKHWHDYFIKQNNIPIPDCIESQSETGSIFVNEINSTMNFDLRNSGVSSKSSFDQNFTNFIDSGNVSQFKDYIEALISIKPTSTDVERSFSLIGYIMAPRRHRISDELLDAICIVNRFYKS